MRPPRTHRPTSFRGSLLVALVALVPAAGATARSPRVAPIPQEDDGQRAVGRVLTLRDGRTVRATTRHHDGRWELKRDGAWQVLPAGAVVAFELERRLESEYDRLRRAAERDDLTARTDIARWAFEKGLKKEGLAQIEGVLGADPDHALAREVLAANAHAFVVPRVTVEGEGALASANELLAWSATRAAATRELAVLELARIRDRGLLEGTLTESLFATTMGRRRTAALALRRLFPGRALEPLIHRAVLDPASEVRVDAALGLKAAATPATVVPVARALESRHPKVRQYAAAALGQMGYPAAVPALVARLSTLAGDARKVPHSHIYVGTHTAYIQDFDVEVAQFSAAADPIVNVLVTGAVLDAGVHSVAEVQFATEGRVLRRSLRELTGLDPGNSNRAWLRWWDERGADWLDGETNEEIGGETGEHERP